MSPLIAVGWIYLLAWLPFAGLVGAAVVGWRWGWGTLLLTSIGWAALAFILFGLALPGTSTGDGANIALFAFFIPWLFCGSVALLLRHKRHRPGAVHGR